jgi:hypothetical protein
MGLVKFTADNFEEKKKRGKRPKGKERRYSISLRASRKPLRNRAMILS